MARFTNGYFLSVLSISAMLFYTGGGPRDGLRSREHTRTPLLIDGWHPLLFDIFIVISCILFLVISLTQHSLIRNRLKHEYIWER